MIICLVPFTSIHFTSYTLVLLIEEKIAIFSPNKLFFHIFNRYNFFSVRIFFLIVKFLPKKGKRNSWSPGIITFFPFLFFSFQTYEIFIFYFNSSNFNFNCWHSDFFFQQWNHWGINSDCNKIKQKLILVKSLNPSAINNWWINNLKIRYFF